MSDLSPTIAQPTKANGLEPAMGSSFCQGDKAFTVIATVCDINIEYVGITSPTGRYIRLHRARFDHESYVGREVYNRAWRALETLKRSYREAGERWAHLSEVEIEMTGDEMVAFAKAVK